MSKLAGIINRLLGYKKKELISLDAPRKLATETKEEHVVPFKGVDYLRNNKGSAIEELTPILLNSLMTFLSNAIQDSISLNIEGEEEGFKTCVGKTDANLFILLDMAVYLLYRLPESERAEVLKDTEISYFYLQRNSNTAHIQIKDVPQVIGLFHGVTRNEDGDEVPTIKVTTIDDEEDLVILTTDTPYRSMATKRVVIDEQYELSPYDLATTV